MRFVFYGRVSPEDWQDPVISRARQLAQAAALVAGYGQITGEYFDAGQSRVLPWARRPQAAALLAAMADPGAAGLRPTPESGRSLPTAARCGCGPGSRCPAPRPGPNSKKPWSVVATNGMSRPSSHAIGWSETFWCP